VPKVKPIFANLLSGQNDTRVEEGTEFPRWVSVRNARLRDGSLSGRPGMKRVAVCGTDATSLDLTAASSHHVVIPAPAHYALTAPYTLEFLIEPDAYAGTQAVVGFSHATDWPFRVWLDGATIKVTLTDSGGSAETLSLLACSGTAGEQFAGQVKVDADGGYTRTVHAYLTDGSYSTYPATGTLSIGTTLKAPGGDLYFGRDNGGNYYDGHLDYFRLFRIEAPNFDMSWARWPSPRQDYVVADYGGEIDSNDWVWDRSRYENHGEAVNSPGTGTALAINPAPVQAIRPYLDKDNKPRLLVIAGGRVHSVEV